MGKTAKIIRTTVVLNPAVKKLLKTVSEEYDLPQTKVINAAIDRECRRILRTAGAPILPKTDNAMPYE